MSIQHIQGVVENIESRRVNTRNGEVMVYDVVLANGPKLTAWERSVAEEAWKTLNQHATFAVDVTQKTKDGRTFTNYSLKEVVLSSLPAGMAPIGNEVGVQAAGFGTPPQTFEASINASNTGAQIDKDVSIHRQVAAKVAAKISQTAPEFWANVNDLFHYFQTGSAPGQNNLGRNETFSQHTEPAPDDDIPF